MSTPPTIPGTPDDLRARIEAARSSGEALAWLLEQCRPHLIRIANDEIDSGLRPKIGASDLAQDSVLEAHRDFGAFRGQTGEDLLAWLRRILRNNLADARRRFQETARRQIRQEELLDAANAGPLREKIIAPTPAPPDRAAAREELEALREAVDRLPEDQRRAVELRHRDGLPFADVAAALGRSEDAAKKLWLRAVRRLRTELGGGDAGD